MVSFIIDISTLTKRQGKSKGKHLLVSIDIGGKKARMEEAGLVDYEDYRRIFDEKKDFGSTYSVYGTMPAGSRL